MSTPTVLIVDDESHITQVVSLKLRKAGYRPITAGDGEEGYEVACQQRPDLIITDLQMPYMNGLELCQRLQSNPQTRAIPVVVLTARGYSLGPDDLDRVRVTGMLSKPFSPRELLEHVERALAAGGGADSDAGEVGRAA